MKTNEEPAEATLGSGRPERSRPGRPSKLTAQVEARLLEALRRGHHRESAAALAGISPATLYRYLAADGERYRGFRQHVEAAEAYLEAKLLAVVMDRVPDDPRLALMLLGRRFPDRWGAARGAPARRDDEPGPAYPAPVNVLVVDPSHLEEVAQRRLQQNRDRADGNSAMPTDLRSLREGDSDELARDVSGTP